MPTRLQTLLLVLALCPFRSWAPPPGQHAEEFVHDTTGHYRLFLNGYSAVSPAPGWTATGYSFSVGSDYSMGPVVDVCYFRAAGSDSHFYTAVAPECSNLAQNVPGWEFQGIPFRAGPGEANCGIRSPVYRLYNNRWMFNDSGHRFTPDPDVRAKLIAAGWADEGVAFCTASWVHLPVAEAQVNVNGAAGLPCGDEGVSCLEIDHLPPLNTRIAAYLNEPLGHPVEANPQYPLQTHAVTGKPYFPPGYYHRLDTAQPPGDAAGIVSHTFVLSDFYPGSLGIHVRGADRLGGDYASINPQYRIGTHEFPFARPRDPYLVLDFSLRVATLYRANPESHAYGGPVLLFVDQVSGKSFYVAIVAYGSITLGDGPEVPGRDFHTGRVMVSTTFRAPSFGDRHYGAWIACPGTGACEAETTHFRYLLDRAAFQIALDRARTLEPDLSANPTDYYLESLHFRNETYRDADVGLTLSGFRVGIYSR